MYRHFLYHGPTKKGVFIGFSTHWLAAPRFLPPLASGVGQGKIHGGEAAYAGGPSEEERSPREGVPSSVDTDDCPLRSPSSSDPIVSICRSSFGGKLSPFSGDGGQVGICESVKLSGAASGLSSSPCAALWELKGPIGGDGRVRRAEKREGPALRGGGGLRESVVPGRSQGGEGRRRLDAGSCGADVLQRLWCSPQRPEGQGLDLESFTVPLISFEGL